MAQYDTPGPVGPTGAASPSDPHGPVGIGTFQLIEGATSETEASLQKSAQVPCSACTVDEMVIVDGTHVFVFESPGPGLNVEWIRKDGAEPIDTSIRWHDFTTVQTALGVARGMISQGG